jgi:hypothetical protein
MDRWQNAERVACTKIRSPAQEPPALRINMCKAKRKGRIAQAIRGGIILHRDIDPHPTRSRASTSLFWGGTRQTKGIRSCRMQRCGWAKRSVTAVAADAAHLRRLASPALSGPQRRHGFGAMVHSTFTCTYALSSKKVIDVSTEPHQCAL